MTVILTARELNKAAADARQLRQEGLDVHAQALDVAQDDSVRQLAETIAQEFGRLDVLVNNAAAYVDWRETGQYSEPGCRSYRSGNQSLWCLAHDPSHATPAPPEPTWAHCQCVQRCWGAW
jgi:NAD(P)-dependent dehydrogenase (short-subunit alcohol dehydrogenase family)